MRRSNCFDPIHPPPQLPGQPRGQMKNVCDKKGQGTAKWSKKEGGALQNEGIKVINQCEAR